MNLIVCVDDRMGMAFNKRRQSRDRVVIEDIARLTDGYLLGMDPRSEKLFEGLSMNITSLEDSDRCDYVFLEFMHPSKLSAEPSRIILYRWNRHYPADVHFDLLLDHYHCTQTREFPGSSHETITREVYEK